MGTPMRKGTRAQPRGRVRKTAGDIRAVLREAGPFAAISQAGGRIRIQPMWSGYRPKGCAWVPSIMTERWEDCPTCFTPHQGGVITRMALANAIAEILNDARDDAMRARRAAPQGRPR